MLWRLERERGRRGGLWGGGKEHKKNGRGGREKMQTQGEEGKKESKQKRGGKPENGLKHGECKSYGDKMTT